MSTDDDNLIPPSIELAWGRRQRGTRGPKPGLTLDRIVAAGIKVAMTEGIGALSMTRVAAELGVGTMSLYRYVAAKDELLTLMVDGALGAPPPAPPGEDWRAGLTRWAVGVRSTYQRHSWALRVPISAPPLGPNNVAWLENALEALEATPLSEQEKLSTVLLLSGFVRNDVTLDLDLAAGCRRRRCDADLRADARGTDRGRRFSRAGRSNRLGSTVGRGRSRQRVRRSAWHGSSTGSRRSSLADEA